MNQKDSLFAHPLGDIEGFRFNEAVVDVFPDMLQRSVPGYEAIITQSALLASRYAQPQTRLYDLGCSLGATAIAMRDALASRKQHSVDGIEIHAIDNAPAMVAACRSIIEMPSQSPKGNEKDASSIGENEAAAGSIPILLHEADLEDHPLSDASVVAMNFTLQFVKPAARPALMHKIAEALRPGGALILSEKVCFTDSTVNEMHIDMYHAFKRRNGYSDLEISQKRSALEDVLVPDTLEQHQERLLEAGFRHCTVWFQCFNFASLIAIKA